MLGRLKVSKYIKDHVKYGIMYWRQVDGTDTMISIQCIR